MAIGNSLTQLQQSRNAGNSGGWDVAEPHRNRLLKLLTEPGIEAGSNLCVLGAGNCNDLDLNRLCETFESIDLVDIDLAAMQKGVASQGCRIKGIRLRGECDVTGVWHELAEMAATSEKASIRVDRMLAKSEAWSGLTELGTFDTVASVCLLSQLFDAVRVAVGEEHPRFADIIFAIRQRHLRLLYELANPGGQAILVTDFVSSDTAPMLPTLSDEALSETLLRMISQHNFFTGLNPIRLRMLLTEDPQLAHHVHAIDCTQPWLWNLGPRHYAVTGIRFRKN